MYRYKCKLELALPFWKFIYVLLSKFWVDKIKIGRVKIKIRVQKNYSYTSVSPKNGFTKFVTNHFGIVLVSEPSLHVKQVH